MSGKLVKIVLRYGITRNICGQWLYAHNPAQTKVLVIQTTATIPNNFKTNNLVKKLIF